MLRELMTEIERAGTAVTVGELGRRLGVAPDEVDAALAALRAGGRLVPADSAPRLQQCGSAGMCTRACPGPASCALVVHVELTHLRWTGPPP